MIKSKSVMSILAKPPIGSSSPVVDQRQSYLDAARRFYSEAKEAAAQGDVAASGALILRALDQERRAGGVGPQVMQLIKPRS
ncbi:MAG: hypothetical protein ACON4T_05125 [Synechococcus sp.]